MLQFDNSSYAVSDFSCTRKIKASNLVVKIYKWFFVILSVAQLVFVIVWFLFIKKLDRVIILSSIIYSGSIIIGYISYEVTKYRKRKKELIDRLP